MSSQLSRERYKNLKKSISLHRSAAALRMSSEDDPQQAAAAEVGRIAARVERAVREDQTLGDLLSERGVDVELTTLVWTALQDVNMELFREHLVRTRISRMIEAFNCLLNICASIHFTPLAQEDTALLLSRAWSSALPVARNGSGGAASASGGGRSGRRRSSSSSSISSSSGADVSRPAKRARRGGGTSSSSASSSSAALRARRTRREQSPTGDDERDECFAA